MDFSERPEEIPDDDLFEVRAASEWVREAPAEQPRTLFGDLWLRAILR